MAKLSAYGRHELMRLERTKTDTDLDTEWETKTIAIMSDLTVLSKIKWKHPRHSKPFLKNWSKTGKLKDNNATDIYVKWLIEKGYTKVEK